MNEREALKLALEALDCICSPLHVREIEKIGNAMKAIREALAQPDQEPVAWMREDEDCTDCIVWEQTEEHTIPLYTTPPQRKPLTDEQIGAILEDPSIAEKHQGNWLVLPYAYARAIEAKLREKNGC